MCLVSCVMCYMQLPCKHKRVRERVGKEIDATIQSYIFGFYPASVQKEGSSCSWVNSKNIMVFCEQFLHILFSWICMQHIMYLSNILSDGNISVKCYINVNCRKILIRLNYNFDSTLKCFHKLYYKKFKYEASKTKQ